MTLHHQLALIGGALALLIGCLWLYQERSERKAARIKRLQDHWDHVEMQLRGRK